MSLNNMGENGKIYNDIDDYGKIVTKITYIRGY